MKSRRFHFFAFLLLTAAAAVAGEFPDNPPQPPRASYLGWIPVQSVPAGETFGLDLHRFFQLGDGETFFADAGGNSGVSAEVSKEPFELRVAIPSDAPGLIQIPVGVKRGPDVLHRGILELHVRPRTGHLFRHSAKNESPRRVTVAGDFNGWNTDSHPMQRKEDGFELFVSLPPGGARYKFLVDGQWTTDPGNQQLAPDGSGNSFVVVAGSGDGAPPVVYPRKRENDSMVFSLLPGAARIDKVSAVYQFPDGSSASAEVVLKPATNPEQAEVSIKDLPGGTWVRVVALDTDGRLSLAARAPAMPVDGFQWQDGIIYYAFTDRFINGEESNDAPVKHDELAPQANYNGGDFEGIRQRVANGYFDSLGVNILWLAPLNQNPPGAWQEHLAPYRFYSGYHGYWPVSSTKVEERFGGEDGLSKLVETTHSNGMKIIADLVLKHVHIEHPLWKEHRDWFGTLELPDGRKNLRIWDEHQFTTWFEEWLPGFDFEKEAPVNFLIGNAVDWAERFKLDGYRLDAVKHIPHSFWWKFRSSMRQAVPDTRKPPMYFVGETFMDRVGIMSFVGPNMLDGQFDFPLYDTIIDVFARESQGFGALEESLHASETIYGKETKMSPLIGNHDKPRFLAYADGDLPGLDHAGEIEAGWRNPPSVDNPASYSKLKLAISFLLSIDGVPMIYYGDEVGLTGAGDPDNRRMMPEENELTAPQRAVREHFQKAAAARKAHPALRYGSRRALLATENQYAFARRYFDDAVLCAWNRSEAPANLTLDVAPEFADGPVTDLFSGRDYEIQSGKLRIELPPRSSAFLVAKAP